MRTRRIVELAAVIVLGVPTCGDMRFGGNVAEDSADAGGRAVPDTTPPELVARSPEPDASDVWFRAPIVLTFSEALAAATVSGQTIHVASDAGALDVNVSLSSDGRTVRVEMASTPPAGPVRLTVTVDGVQDRAGNAFAGAQWSWMVPLWQEIPGPPGSDGAATAALALDSHAAPILAWRQGDGAGSELHVARLDEAGWRALGGALDLRPDGAPGPAALVVDHDDRPVMIWTGRDGVYAKRWGERGWEALGDGPIVTGLVGGGPAPAVALDGDRIVLAAARADRTVEVRRWDGAAWAPAAQPWAASGTVHGLDVVVVRGAPVVAATVAAEASDDLLVLRWDADKAKWTALGKVADRARADNVSGPKLEAAADGALTLAWQESDGYSSNVYVARYDAAADTWKLVDRALDLEIDAEARGPALALDATGAPMVAWSEASASGPWRVHVARPAGGRWTVVGSAVRGVRRPDVGAAIALDDRGDPVIAFEAPTAGGLTLRRYNGSPERPFGLDRRAGGSPCKLPEDDDASFPKTLSATGCFSDIMTRTPAPGVIPFDVSAPLWSDGALKRRFVVVPEGKAIGLKESGPFDIPVGTIFVKEFSLERERGNPTTRFPMETRLLVKRCEPGNCLYPWQGYSYQWDDNGREARLLTSYADTQYKDWPLKDGTFRHGYPGRDQCTQCHLLAAGGVLGFHALQLNRNRDYDGVVDNQLRALVHAGVFGDRPPAKQPTDLPQLPRPNDPGHTINERARAYFHGNCSPCHRPYGSWPVQDFRYEAPLGPAGTTGVNLCDKLIPGNADASWVYLKDRARKQSEIPAGVPGKQMPPLGTLLRDDRQLPITKAWIDAMKTCP